MLDIRDYLRRFLQSRGTFPYGTTVPSIVYQKKEPVMAEAFIRPKDFETTAEILRIPNNVPTIQITPIALLKIHTLVGLTTEEISWLGTVSQEGNTYLIEDIYYLRQTCTGFRTKFPVESLNELSRKLLSLPDGMEIWNKLNFWGHSHGTGSVFASKKDTDQMNLFEENGCDYFIRGIFAWNGRLTFSIYNWQANVAFHEVEWDVSSDEPVDPQIAAQIKANTKKWFDDNVTIVEEPESFVAEEVDEMTMAYPWNFCNDMQEKGS